MSCCIKISRQIKILLALSTVASTAIFVSSGPAMAQLSDAKKTLGSFYKTLTKENSALTDMLQARRIGDRQLGNADEIRAFYEAREGKPVWIDSIGGPNRARQFAAVIEQSWTHGLNPARYHLQEINDRLNEKDEVLEAELELYLTDAVVKYVRDMSGQRLQGKTLDGEIMNRREPLQTLAILNAVAGTNNLKNLLSDIEPKSGTYKNLRNALIDLTDSAEADYAKYLPLDFGGILRPGQRHKNIPGLRARLNAAQQTSDPLLYDDALFAAVMRFQKEASLKDDGVIGLDTLTALNRTNRERVMQLRVNMERLRWIEGLQRPGKFIVVNIPAATLWAVTDRGVEFEMPVIVGRPERATPALIAEIKGVRFNPDWTVPPTIKKEDILPQLREDPYYLTNKGIELTYRGPSGVETLDPSAVDWERVTSSDLHVLNMVQVPGAQNPLGRVRVLMPNKHSIYLHDTNQKEYFDKYARALSSGCIRMKDPLRVAEFIMSTDKGWDMEKINSVIAQGRTSDRLISAPIPVYILYYTVWIDDQGRVVFGRDIYNRDKALAHALDAMDGVRVSSGDKIMNNQGG